MSFMQPFLLGPVHSDHPPMLWCLSHGQGGMQLHDVVGINCKKGATIENQGIDVKYMDKGVYVDDGVCVL